MSGGGAGPIIIHHARTALADPIVHGQLPPSTAVMVDAVFDKADADWTAKDKAVIGKAFHWALCNLP
jgi:hypothetical protein